MLQLTPTAVRHLVTIREERGIDNRAGARFVRKDGHVGLTFALAPLDGDQVVEDTKIKVFVAAEIAAAMEQSIIDARDEEGRTALVVRKQAATRPMVGHPAN